MDLGVDAQQSIAELKEAIVRSSATYAAAISGIRRIIAEMQKLPRHPENADPHLGFVKGDPNLASTQHAGRMRFSEFATFAEVGGPAECQLGQQWLVYIYTLWESEFRPRLAAALECSLDQIDVPILGDLRLMRNDVVHNRGVASAERSGKCKELMWFNVGDPIYIQHDHVAELEGKVQGLEFQWIEEAK